MSSDSFSENTSRKSIHFSINLKKRFFQNTKTCDAYILKYQPGEDIGIDDVEVTEEFVSEEG